MSSSFEKQDELLTLDELLRLIPLARGTIYRYTSRGMIPYMKLGNRLVFRKSEIDDWLEAKRV